MVVNIERNYARFHTPPTTKTASSKSLARFSSAINVRTSNKDHFFRQIQAKTVRFGTKSLITRIEDFPADPRLILTGGSSQVELLANKALEIKARCESPYLTMAHLTYAILSQAHEELSMFDGLGNRQDSLHKGKEVGKFPNLFANPPIFTGLFDEALFRKPFEHKTMSFFNMRPDNIVAEPCEKKTPEKVLKKPWHFPRQLKDLKNIRSLFPSKQVIPAKTEHEITLPIYQATLLKEEDLKDLFANYGTFLLEEQKLRDTTLPKAALENEEKACLKLLTALRHEKGRALYTADILKALTSMSEQQVAESTPITQGVHEKLNHLKEEIEIFADKGNAVRRRWMQKLNEASLRKEGMMPPKTRLAIQEEVQRFEDAHRDEKGVNRQWINRALSIPWTKTPTLRPEDIDLKNARKTLDKYAYGMQDVKDEVLNYLAAIKQGAEYAPILMLVGDPGTGKTSIAKALAEITGRRFVKRSVAGVNRVESIKGGLRENIGAGPGLIHDGLMEAKCLNPLFLLDEADKLGNANTDPELEHVKGAMLPILDRTQNHEFRDTYFGFETPLNDIFWVLTANTTKAIPPALRDRIRVIDVPRYTDEEKRVIAQQYLLPDIFKERHVDPQSILFEDSAIHKITGEYTREGGVRTLRQALETVVEKIIRQRQESILTHGRFNRLAGKDIEKYLGPPSFSKPKTLKGVQPGETMGLGVMRSYGGNTLIIQTPAVQSDSWRLGDVTGVLGKTIQESTKYILHYIEANADRFVLRDNVPKPINRVYRSDLNHFMNEPKPVKGYKINVHIKPAAMPKDGPSAGVAIAISMISAITGIPVRKNVAFTGEIDCYGRIEAVGGIREKMDAAYRARDPKAKMTVFIPKDNEKDLKKVPYQQLEALNIVPVEDIEEVLTHPDVFARSPYKFPPLTPRVASLSRIIHTPTPGEIEGVFSNDLKLENIQAPE